jgi:tRNA(Arg) A34 adenosine deaminase TadA
MKYLNNKWHKILSPSNKDKNFINLAIKAANQGNYKNFRHGAVLTKSGTVLNISYNKQGYNSFGARFRNINFGNATLHAELGAILNIEKSLTIGSTIYVVRINNCGNLRLSRPCKMCEDAMKFCGVKKVMYSTEKGFKVFRLS